MLVFIPTASKGFLQFCVKAGTFREQLVENKYPYKYWDLDLPLPCRLQLIMSGKQEPVNEQRSKNRGDR